MTPPRALALIVVLAACPEPARGEPIPAKARALADRGRAAHDQRDYAGAIAAFTEAYAIAPAPALLFNLAQAYRLKGACEDAQLMYRRYLATNPSDDGRTLAEMHLASVERCIQARTLRVTVDPQLRALAIPKAPPPQTFVGSPRRQPRSRDQQVGAGIAIAGGGALLVAAYYALDSHRIAEEIERRYADGEKWTKLAPLDAKGDREASHAKIAAITGGATLAVSAAVIVIDLRRAKTKLRVEPTASGARIRAVWQF